MSYFKPLKEELRKYFDRQQIEAVYAAFLLAQTAHASQKRSTGEPYVSHPVAVATILAKMRMDQATIISALLHDVIEDTQTSKSDITNQFGKAVADLVDGVTKLTKIQFETREEANAENFRKMILAMAKDTRVILIKMADRLHNMRTLGALPAHKRSRIAKETLDIYAPIANRLGMHTFQIELEDLGFSSLYPERYRVLTQSIKRARGNRKEVMKRVDRDFRARLRQFDVTVFTIAGREKHPYSLYKKMRAKQLSFSEVMDVYAFRVIVSDIDACYRVLGILHNLYKPIPTRFKDYIAIPKANGYQSLHTVLFGPFGVPIEVQIRTTEMNRVAESGIAAHWIYKDEQNDFGTVEKQAREWIQGVMEMQQNTGSSLEFIENVKTDLFPDEVYVFSPKGRIIKLPANATPVDFAYAVHSDIGNHCIAAKIDKVLAPLSMPLESGQTVEVITSGGSSPNPAWLNFVKTGKARSNIRHFLKSKRQSEAKKLGKRLLERALKNLGVKLSAIESKKLSAVLKAYDLNSLEDLFSDIGLGVRNASLSARQLTETAEIDEAPLSEGLMIKGTEGMVLVYADCCRPIPGDNIVGVLDKGKGVDVHREACPMLSKHDRSSGQLIPLSWSPNIKGDFTVDIGLALDNRRGILAGLALAIAEAESNIDTISAEEIDGMYFTVNLTLTVQNRVHLAKVLRRIRRLPGLMHVSRQSSIKSDA